MGCTASRHGQPVGARRRNSLSGYDGDKIGSRPSEWGDEKEHHNNKNKNNNDITDPHHGHRAPRSRSAVGRRRNSIDLSVGSPSLKKVALGYDVGPLNHSFGLERETGEASHSDDRESASSSSSCESMLPRGRRIRVSDRVKGAPGWHARGGDAGGVTTLEERIRERLSGTRSPPVDPSFVNQRRRRSLAPGMEASASSWPPRNGAKSDATIPGLELPGPAVTSLSRRASLAAAGGSDTPMTVSRGSSDNSLNRSSPPAGKRRSEGAGSLGLYTTMPASLPPTPPMDDAAGGASLGPRFQARRSSLGLPPTTSNNNKDSPTKATKSPDHRPPPASSSGSSSSSSSDTSSSSSS
jgi:hypothetical protein